MLVHAIKNKKKGFNYAFSLADKRFQFTLNGKNM
jgi:hypothetical protein